MNVEVHEDEPAFNTIRESKLAQDNKLQFSLFLEGNVVFRNIIDDKTGLTRLSALSGLTANSPQSHPQITTVYFPPQDFPLELAQNFPT